MRLVIETSGAGSPVGYWDASRSVVGMDLWIATFNVENLQASRLGRVEREKEPIRDVEVESRAGLERFNRDYVTPLLADPYEHVMVIEGNDPRGIDVRILSRFSIDRMRSHVDDRTDAESDHCRLTPPRRNRFRPFRYRSGTSYLSLDRGRMMPSSTRTSSSSR